MEKLTEEQVKKIEECTLRLEVSPRGGGIEIDLTKYGYIGEKMNAHQNYLGGGLLGRVVSDCTLNYKGVDIPDVDKLKEIEKMLKLYYFTLTNPVSSDDEVCWESQTFDQNQTSYPVSSY
jgi:hypothetical protein